MRDLVGIFGLVCGAVVVWTVANYGYASADDPAVKWNMAFLFGVIATGDGQEVAKGKSGRVAPSGIYDRL